MCNGMFLVAEREEVFQEKQNIESKSRTTDGMEEFETENECKESVFIST